MMHMIVQVLAPIFFVLALGYAAGWLRIVDNTQVGGFNKLVMNFALPASLLVATSSASRAEMIEQAPLFAITAPECWSFSSAGTWCRKPSSRPPRRTPLFRR